VSTTLTGPVLDDVTQAAIRAVASQTGTCRLCGDPVRQVPSGDEWAWAGPDGRTLGTDRDLRSLPGWPAKPDPDPYAHLTWLAGRMDAAMKACGGPRGTRASLTPLYWAAAREYSSLKVRLEMSLTFHQHTVTAQRDCPAGGNVRRPLPYHCAWPMRLTPSGWACRQCPHRQGTAVSQST
jgi:hypothetical protein